MNIFKNKIVTVTGAGGSIGSAICKKLLLLGVHRLKCLDISEYSLYNLSQSLKSEKARYLIGDVRDKDRLDRAVSSSHIIIHAAALKHVSFCEFNPDEAFKTNVIGTQNLIDICRKTDTEHCVLISTDKAVNPTSVMGTTKLLAEKIFINAPENNLLNSTKFTVVRFGNVFGSAGSVVETFFKKISNNEKLSLTDENISRYFISMNEASNLVLDCLNHTKGESLTPVFILKMKKAKIKRIAERMSYILGKNQNHDFEITGLSRGEKFDEKLYTDFERKFIQTTEKYIIINKNIQNYQIEEKDFFMSDGEIDFLIKEWLESKKAYC